MRKKRLLAHRSETKANDKVANLRVGEVITGAEILGMKDDGPKELRWLRGGESPYGMDVLDCRAFALYHVATTRNPAVAESFRRNAESNGKEYIGQFPESPREMEFTFRFPLLQGKLTDGPLFVSHQMEDKWNIYLHKGILYFTRSWTGNLVHVARCELNENFLIVTSTMTSGETFDERDEAFFVREVFFLIVSHLLGSTYPHPLPAYLEPDDEKIALWSFSQYGRRGLYAAFPVFPASDDGEAPEA